MTRLVSLRSKILLLVLLCAALPADGQASAEDGVLAEMPFLDAIPRFGPVTDGHIGIDLSADPERPFPMLLDTGAQSSVMTPLYARQLRVSVRKHKTTEYRKATSLGRDLLFWVDTSSSQTGSRTGLEVGLVGGNFLQEYVVEVDYVARRVRFLDPAVLGVSEDRLEPGEFVVPMRFTDGRPQIEIQLGNGSAWFLMDTGAPLDLGISEEGAKALGIAIPQDATISSGANLYGTERWAHVPVPSAKVGKHEIRDLGLDVALREGATYRVTNVAGQAGALLGNAFLRRFRVRFDYPNRRIALLPRPVAEDATEPPPAAQQRVWLDVSAPQDGSLEEGLVHWTEVRGWAGIENTVQHDVILLVDTSGSTALASGVDIDGDGKLGVRGRERASWRSFNPRNLNSDPGDSVLAAELGSVRLLLTLLDPVRTRIGIVSFSGRGKLEAPLGSDETKLASTLEKLADAFGSGATNLTHATRLAIDALVAGRDKDAEGLQQSIIVLSDGYPSSPADVLEVAHDAARAGVRIFSFTLGEGKLDDDAVFVEIASITGGEFVRVPNPGEIMHVLPRINLARVASVEIRNASLDKPARAIRTFPDGSFDGFVPLAEGDNEISIVARGDLGGQVIERRHVRFEPREPVDEADALRFQERRDRFREALRARTVETQIAMQAQAAKEAELLLRRELRIEVEAEP